MALSNHFYVSMIKSIVRISAGGALAMNHLVSAGIMLIIAEIIGIIEEIV